MTAPASAAPSRPVCHAPRPDLVDRSNLHPYVKVKVYMSLLTLVPRSPLPAAKAEAPPTLRIGDLARATDKTQRALRLYEELGLLPCGERTAGGYRLYGPEAIDRVHWIGKLPELGFTLQQIQHLVQALHAEHVPKAAMNQVRSLFMNKLDDVAAQIARLSQLQRELVSSLAYLETCGDCSTEAPEGEPGAVSCSSCTEHDEHAPSLVEQTRRTAARPLHGSS